MAKTARKPFPWVVTLAGVVTGVVAGLASVWLATGGLIGAGALRNGGWSTDLTIGSEAANPWVRAQIARVGLLALPRSQTLYFDRTTDEAGAALDARCRYAIAGKAIPARWWSITAYGGDQMLSRAANGPVSIDATRLGARAAGDWTVTAGPTDGGETPDLSISGLDRVILMLRLYNPDAADPIALKAMELPTVTRLSCDGGAS
jgi:hypothetical protein